MIACAIVLAALLPLGSGGVGGIDLDQLSRAEIAVVGRIVTEEPSARQVAWHEEGESKARAFGVYTVSVDAVVKGVASGTITVLAGSTTDWTGWPGKVPSLRDSGLSLPVGKRLLLFLQQPHDGKFKCTTRPTGSREAYLDAPSGVGFALYDFVGKPAVYEISDSAFAKLALKHDYPGRDLARVLVLAADETHQSQPADSWSRLMYLWPHPDASLILAAPARSEYREFASILGPDPFGFYTTEVLPNLPDLAGLSVNEQSVAKLILGGRWGDPNAADQIATGVLALGLPSDKKSVDMCAAAASSVRDMLGGDNASARLLQSPIKRVQRVALFGLQGSPKHRAEVRAFLWSDDSDVLIQAMDTLCAIESMSHTGVETHRPDRNNPTMEAGSHNAAMLDYWRKKQ